MATVEASTPITAMGELTVAPNKLPAPPATAGMTMGSRPRTGAGLRETGVRSTGG